MSDSKGNIFWEGIVDNRLFQNFILPVVDLLIIGLFGGTLFGAWLAIEAGQIQYVGSIAQFAGAVGTAGLLRITYSYTRSTRNLVKESKRQRKEEQRRRNRERLEKTNSLRRGLIKEIQAVTFVESEDGTPLEPSQLLELKRVVPTEVYEGNTDKIGMLTDEEVEYVVEYYSVAYHLEDLLKAHRDTKKESRLGFFDSEQNSKFVSAVSDRHKMLKEAQGEVVEILEENLHEEGREKEEIGDKEEKIVGRDSIIET